MAAGGVGVGSVDADGASGALHAAYRLRLMTVGVSWAQNQSVQSQGFNPVLGHPASHSPFILLQ